MAEWARRVEGSPVGKRVGDALYLHADALAAPRAALAELAGCAPDAFDVVRVTRGGRLGLLAYPGFFDDAFPSLHASWALDLATGAVERRAYRPEANPPILHRKELLLAPDDPRRAPFEALTREAEARGLFEDSTIIGHRAQWEEELRARGVRVEGHRLVPLGDATEPAPQEVHRHRTALSRRALSTPMQALWRHGYLVAEHAILDYGCGRGDDLATLQSHGLRAEGWDPHFRPDGRREPADVVNLGFVLNVIEDPVERAEALTGAYRCARRVLAVAALIGGRTAFERYRLFGDGVLTSRGTFQKYFTHAELGAYIHDVLGREPVSVGPGLYFVFRADDDEQDFLERRQRSAAPPDAPAPPPRAEPARAKPPPRTRSKQPRAPAAEPSEELVASFWQACVALGRLPREGEFAREPELAARAGSPGLVLRRLIERHGEAAWEDARRRRCGDLLVFLALNQFERRRSAGAATPRVRHDLREFWGGGARAEEEARKLLFSLRSPEAVASACAEAAAAGVGHLAPGESLQLDARLVNDLPPALRVYLGCAGKLYGEAQDADMVKVHLGSSKVTLMTYDDYEGAAIPRLIERVKVDLRRQHVDFFQYGDAFEPQPLYGKSRFMHPRLAGYAAQRAFDEALMATAGFDWSGYGPPLAALTEVLAAMTPPEGMRVTAAEPPPAAP
ncbi:MAG: DNA phosphorothioation-associated putative methyltransferase [Polyangiales bacterium]